jgi:hypothetical protein
VYSILLVRLYFGYAFSILHRELYKMLCLLRTHDTKRPMCFPEYSAKMDGLSGVSNLLGDKAPMQFASSIFMSG